MSMFLSYLPFLIVMICFVSTIIIVGRQVQRRLQQWLDSQGFHEVKLAAPPLFRPGPFFMLNKRGWGVKRLTVRQADGKARSGWIMYPAGLFVERMSEEEYQVKLIWEDEWDPNDKPLVD